MNKENFFYKNRLNIGKFAEGKKLDVDVACMQYLQHKGLKLEDYRAALNEFIKESKVYLGNSGKTYNDIFHGEG